MLEEKVSEREQIARDLFAAAADWRGPILSIGRVSPEGKQSYWSLFISKPRTIDAEIRIYGPRFVLVNHNGNRRKTDIEGARAYVADPFGWMS